MFRISQWISCCVVTAASLFLAQSAGAQAPAPAQEPINVVHGGIDRLYSGIDYVFGLANEPANLKTLKETLDVFFVGVDTKKAAIIQVYVRKGKFNLVLHAPIDETKKAGQKAGMVRFKDNMRALGLKNQPLGMGWYKVKGLFEGFMREISGPAPQTPVMIIGEDRTDMKPLGDHAAYNKKLNPENHDLVATIKNDSKLTKDREQAIEEVRKQVMPGLKKLKQETDAEFEWRKLTLDQLITEVKQIYAEASLMTAFGDLSPTKKTAVLDGELEALPDTPLSTGISLLGKEPSYFANIPLNDKEPLSGFINFHLDEMRKEHLLAFLKQARPLLHKRIEDAEADNAKTKDYVLQSTDIAFDVFEQSVKNDLLDGFVNVHTNASKFHTLVGGTRGDGAIVKERLAKLKQATEVKLDAGKIGDLSLHKVTVPAGLTELHSIYGKDLELIVGTSSKSIWYAMGENAEEKLKEAVELTEKPAATKSTTIASLHASAHLWYKLIDQVQLKQKKGNEDDRKAALAALEKGNDTFDFKLELVDGKTLKSKFSLQEGMLRYFGKVGAKFVKDNLQN